MFSVRLDCDGKDWEPNKICVLTERIPARACELYLNVRRKKDGKRIYFANQYDDDGRIPLGRIRIEE